MRFLSWLHPRYIFPRKGRGGTLYILTAVTLAYLLLEFSFNSRLLDAVGGLTASTSIQGIEQWGRLLSGFAVALLAWPWILHGRVPARPLVLVLLTALIMAGVYQGEKALLDGIVARSNPRERYAASNLMLLQHALLSGDARIDGLDLGRESMQAPDGKAFLATFPFMLLAIQDIDQKIADQRESLLRRMVDAAYGGPAANFDRYARALRKLRSDYADYLAGSRRYDAAIADIGRQQSQAWIRYESNLRRHGLNPYSVSPFYAARVRASVRRSGVPVGPDWHPGDRDAFYAAVARRVREQADQRFHASIRAKLGADLAPNLDSTQFVDSAPIQKRLDSALCYPAGTAVPLGYRNPAEFDHAVYSKVIARVTAERLARLTAPVQDYADGGPDAAEGRANMRALVAPPLALAFSVSGAVVHIFKVFFFLIQCLTGRGWRNGWIKTGAIGIGTALSFAFFSQRLHSPITDQEIFRSYIYPEVVAIYPGHKAVGDVVATAIQGTIHFQPYAYPVFESIRKGVFRGADFGFHPNSTVRTVGHARCGSVG